MKNDHTEAIHRINYLTTEMASLYHKASLKLGISDSVSVVLYFIYDAGDGCLLSDIRKKCGISKQTVNSAIRGLENDGILFLRRHDGRAKRIFLTEKGREYIRNTAARLYRAECDAFDSWTKEETETYIRLMEKYTDCLGKQIEKL